MFTRRLQRHQIDHVYHPNSNIGNEIAEQHDCGKSLKRWHVARARHYYIRIPFIIAGPLENAESRRAMLHCSVHVQPYCLWLLARNDHVYVLPAPQTMLRNRKQRVGVWRQINAYDVSLLIGDMVYK